MADVFNKEPVDFVDLNELFPVLNSAVGLTYEQFRILVENTFWLKNQEEIGVVKAFIVSGSSEFGALWLSETDGGAPLAPNPEYIYIVQTNGNFKNKLFSWNGSLYEQLAKDSDNNYTNADKSKVDKLITNGNGTKYLANDGIYKTISGSGGIPEAPIDNKQYVRKDASWEKSSRIENLDSSRFIDTNSDNISIDLMPSLSQGGGSETGRLKLARNMFELSAERIYANPNLKYKYFFGTKTDGSIELEIEDAGYVQPLDEEERKETYSFDFSDTNNPNQVARKFEVDLAIQQAIEDVLLGEV